MVVLANSGRIMGRAGAVHRRFRRRAGLFLDLAAPEIFPQRGRETPPLLGLALLFRALGHGRMVAPVARLWEGSRRSPPSSSAYFGSRHPRCRSSVVEYPVGKGEVVSSILPGSTVVVVIKTLARGAHWATSLVDCPFEF